MRSSSITPQLSFTLFWLTLCAVLNAFGQSAAAALPTAQEKALASLMIGSSGQNRPFLRLDPILTQVAQSRAADMAKRGYFSHVNPDGNGPNQLLRDAGYQLPEWWGTDRETNYVESIAAGNSAASSTWNDFMNSAGHKRHLLAESDFYRDQTSYGVGHVSAPGSKYGDYWVVITAPPQPVPKLRITSPSAGSRVSESQVTVTGTTSGETLPSLIQLRVENTVETGAYKNIPGTDTWRAVVSDLAPGVNTIHVRSLDASGSLLAQATCKVVYVFRTPLTVTVVGGGSISAGFEGESQRELGIRYTVTAHPAADSIFAGWSGGVDSSDPKLTFTMSEGLQLTANFVPNPFLAVGGSYSGVVNPPENPTPSTAGMIRANVTSKGAFTGKLTFGSKTYRLSGRFDINGIATITVPRRNKSPLVVSLQLNVSGTPGLNVTVSDGSVSATAQAQRVYRSKAGAYPHAGRYTVSLFPEQSGAGAAIPQGNGYATLQVDRSGSVRMVVKLADGTSFSRAGAASEQNSFSIFSPLYSGHGFTAGELRFSSTDVSDLEGTMVWSKNARPSDRFYPAGFETTLQIVGSRYTVPKSGTPVVHVTPGEGNGALSLGNGDLNQVLVQPLTIDANNRVHIDSPTMAGFSVSISANSGTFTGKFKHPVSGKIHPLRGVIFQKQNAGYGFFLGVHESGYSSLMPTGN